MLSNTKNYRYAVTLLWAAFWLIPTFAGIQSAQSTEDTNIQTITSARPMNKMADLLQDIYSKPFSYEDPILQWNGDISPRDGWRGLYPVNRSFIIQFQLNPLNQETAPNLSAVMLDSIVDAYNKQSGGPIYEIRQSDMSYYIVPIMVRDNAGHLEKITPLLDLYIDVQDAKRLASEHFAAICSSLTAASGIKVNSFTYLMDRLFAANNFKPSRILSESEKERASFIWGAHAMKGREAVIDLLDNSATTMSWKLLYDYSENSFVFSPLPITHVYEGADGQLHKVLQTYDRKQVQSLENR